MEFFMKSYRRPKGVNRYEVLFNLETLMFYNSISLNNIFDRIHVDYLVIFLDFSGN